MTEPEGFLERWSRRKLAKAEPLIPKPTASQQSQGNGEDTATAAPKVGETAAANSQPLDLASLPTIDSIGANTDIAAFLRPGVPSELARAALRRAWTSDPAIRDFVGLVENGWDFNNPEAISGFGAISARDVARLASKIIGEPPQAASKPLKVQTIQCEDKPPLLPAGAADGAGPDVTSEELSRDRKHAAVQKDTDA
jgi:Protein of unknown function (DUF3306)